MPITLLDGILLVVMLISAALAMIRGFVREVLSIASWVLAAISAYTLYGFVLPFTKQYISNGMVALGTSVAVIFLVTLVIVSYITMRISDFVLDSRIGALDRSLGFVFGAARGMLLMVVAVIFFNWFVPVNKQPDWVAYAKSRPLLVSIGEQLIAALPEDPEQTFMDRIHAEHQQQPADTTAAQQQPVTTTATQQPQQTTSATPATKTGQDQNTGYSTSERQGLDQLTTSGSGN